VNISVSLPKDLAEFVEDRVRSGEYDSADDVIGEALRVLEAQSLLVDADKEALRQAWLEGIESGDYAPVDLDVIREEGRRLLKSNP
jgi:antitoxin ParD1/3/4